MNCYKQGCFVSNLLLLPFCIALFLLTLPFVLVRRVLTRHKQCKRNRLNRAGFGG